MDLRLWFRRPITLIPLIFNDSPLKLLIKIYELLGVASLKGFSLVACFSP